MEGTYKVEETTTCQEGSPHNQGKRVSVGVTIVDSHAHETASQNLIIKLAFKVEMIWVNVTGIRIGCLSVSLKAYG